MNNKFINFNRYKGYSKPTITIINEYVHIVTHKSITKDGIDIIDIYNKKENTYISLYNTTLINIYNIMNKKLYNTKKTGTKESKKKKMLQDHADLIF